MAESAFLSWTAFTARTISIRTHFPALLASARLDPCPDETTRCCNLQPSASPLEIFHQPHLIGAGSLLIVYAIHDLADDVCAQSADLYGVERARAHPSRVQRLPSIHHLPEIVEDGGLVGYGARLTLMYRQMARLLVKVLRGTAPADLPVEQPATFELVFNLKTAAAIGRVVPPTLLLRAAGQMVSAPKSAFNGKTP